MLILVDSSMPPQVWPVLPHAQVDVLTTVIASVLVLVIATSSLSMYSMVTILMPPRYPSDAQGSLGSAIFLLEQSMR